MNLNWAYKKYHHIFGSFTYLGKPVHGFKTTSTGVPLDTFGRNLYLDTFDSAYAKGWMRENSFLMHKGTGKFCYGFYRHGARPEGDGDALSRDDHRPRRDAGHLLVERCARRVRPGASTCRCTRCRRSSSPATRSAARSSAQPEA